MTTDTDIRLRSRLDANQLAREQMCRAILGIDPHYSDVRPRHPAGGRDGGRDIEAVYDGTLESFGAVGFVNGANDSAEQKKQIKAKFKNDLNSALSARSNLKSFAFLTNIQLTVDEKEGMKGLARKRGIIQCDVFDRERIRIELDTPSGFFIRFQYLEIPLSVEEQASFLSKYGDQIQDVISTGFQRVERALDRLLFLAESKDVLEGVYVRFTLKKSYPAGEINHFRAFTYLALRAVTHGILTIWFGSTDKSGRFREDSDKLPHNYGKAPGIGAGIAGGQWEQHFHNPAQDGIEDSPSEEIDEGEDGDESFTSVGWSDSVGMDPVPAIVARYNHDGGMIRFEPRLQLRDLDDSSFMPVMNLKLARMVHSIQVFSNGYKLADYGPEDFRIDSDGRNISFPGTFSDEELADPWVRIRPSSFASNFHLRFSDKTPRRMYEYKEIRDTPAPNP